jgi:hypothetical protein
MFGQIGAGQWLRSAAAAMTVALCAACTLIAASRRAQMPNLAAASTRR